MTTPIPSAGSTATATASTIGGTQGPGQPEGHVPQAPGRPDEVPGPGEPGEQQRVHGADGDLHPGGEARGDRRAERLHAGPAALQQRRRPGRTHGQLHRRGRRDQDRRRHLRPPRHRLERGHRDRRRRLRPDGPHHRGLHRAPDVRHPVRPRLPPTPEEFLPMLRSMFSAISGLRAHQTKMDVTGNNIANVNTVGYKGSQTVFQDTLSQVIRAGGAPAADRGGTNPAQVGLGVKVAATTTNWTQGATQSTGPLDGLHDRGRRLLRDPERQRRAAVHPRRVLRLRRRRQARHPGRLGPAGLDGRRRRHRQPQRADR